MQSLLNRFLLIPILFIFSCSGQNTESTSMNPRIVDNFNHDWEFFIDSTGYKDPYELVHSGNDPGWEQVSIPHTPRIEPLVVNDQWQGDCWYRKSFRYRDEWNNRRLFLRFEGAMNVAEVWINNEKKIMHLGGYLPFVIDISDDVVKEGENTVYIRLNNEDNPITGPKALEILDFNTYGGIYREVLFMAKNTIHISDEQFAGKVAGGGVFVSYPEVNEKTSTVSIKTHVVNSGSLDNEVKIIQHILQDGNIVAKNTRKIRLEGHSDVEVEQQLHIDYPALWSPQDPNLYRLVTQVKNGNTTVDQQVTSIGIRRFEFIDRELYLNGRKLFLRGVNRHQEYPYLGYAISGNADYRDALKIKQAGFDYVRLSHYPHSKTFLDACDELGIVVIDAILGWQYYFENDEFRNHIYQTARDMIRRDRNHPSILAWEVSLNESRMPEDFILELNSIAKEEYPYPGTYTAGWQVQSYDIYMQARQHRIRHRNPEYPDKPYIVSEYGDWEYYAMNAGLNQAAWENLLPGERSSRQELSSGEKRLLQQALNIQEAHNDNFNTPAAGDGYWVMFDYNRGYADDLESSGIMSIFRLPKFSYHFFRSQRDPEEKVVGTASGPVLFIASYFNEESGKDVRIFSNCEEVELFLNGRSLGVQRPDEDRYSDKLVHPPFTFRNLDLEPGELKATGKINGEVVAGEIIASPGKASSLELIADISGKDWESGCKDAIFIYARIIDENGQVLFDQDARVHFAVTGNARIIGNPSPDAEAGIASILVMAGDEPGEITVTASSGDLETGNLILHTIPAKD